MSRQTSAPDDTAKLQHLIRELSILNAIAQALNREIDLTRALQTTLAKVAELFDLKTGWVWLVREETGESYLAATQNLPPGLANYPHRMEGTCYCLDSFRAGDLDGAANVNVITCSRLKGLVDGTDGLRYHASIPLQAHGKELGVLNVASTDWRELSPDDLQLLYTIGDLVSIAVERAQLFAKSVELGAAEERNRLAREIHDTLAQGLTAITLQLETADALIEAKGEITQAQQAVQQALTLTRANLDEARRSVIDLRAAPLEGRTLAEALAALTHPHDWTKKYQTQIKYEVIGGQRPLPLHIEAGLYRIAQEALHNVIRHANAQQVIVQLITTPERVQLIVEDNGQGFEPTQMPPNRYGLIGLNERVKLLGGSLQLESSPGTGTRVEVKIPLGVSS